MLGQILRGEFGGIAPDLAAAAVGMSASEAFANFLQNPKIMRLLTEPTAADVRQIPPELRSQLLPVVEEARKRGVNVSPYLAAFVGATGSGKLGAGTLPRETSGTSDTVDVEESIQNLDNAVESESQGGGNEQAQ
jgi:hypothetical protein